MTRRATTPRELKQAIRDSIAALPAPDAALGRGGAYTRTCTRCGRTGTRGFTSQGYTFALRGRTRTAQRLNMRSGPCTWECSPGHGCTLPDATVVIAGHTYLIDHKTREG